MGWSGTHGTKADEVDYLERIGFKGDGIELVKRTSDGNWWLFKSKNDKGRAIHSAVRVLWDYDRKEKMIYRKEIGLESGPDLKGFPMAWIPLLDLGDKERYRYGQLEELMSMKTAKANDYIPRLGDCIMGRDGSFHVYSGIINRKRLKYKYCFTCSGITKRWSQRLVNESRARFEKRCVPVIIGATC